MLEKSLGMDCSYVTSPKDILGLKVDKFVDERKVDTTSAESWTGPK